MKVVLLKDIPGVGRRYEVKNLHDGYVRNFLLPKKLVQIADDSVLKTLEAKKTKEQEIQRERRRDAENYAQQLEGVVITFKLKIGPQGNAFGSVTDKDIKQALEKRGIKNTEVMLQHLLKTKGLYEVELGLGEGVKVILKVAIEAD